MKLKSCVLAASLACAAFARAQTNDLTGLLQQGLFEEEANRNLDAAIAAYQSLAGAFDKDRQTAANAIFRLGEVYRKLGKTNEAVVQYQRIIKDFSDQQTLVTLSEQNLQGLRAPGSTESPDATKIAVLEKDLADKNAEVAEQQMLLKILKDLKPDALRQALPAVVTDNVLSDLMLKLNSAQQELIQLKTDYSPDHPRYKAAEAAVNDLDKKVTDRIDGILLGLESKLNSDVAYADSLRAQLQKTHGPTAQDQSDSNNNTLLRLQIQRATQQLAHDQERLQELLTHYVPTNPQVVDQQRQVDSDKAALAALTVRVQNLEDSRGAATTSPPPVTDDEEEKEIRRIQVMIQQSPDLINAPSEGATPLWTAAMKGQLVVAKYLLDHGADVNRRSGGENSTPLEAAVENGHKAMVELLISRGAEVNDPQESHNPLYHAVLKGFASVAEVLLDNHADPNLPGDYDRRPLHYAAGTGETNLVQALLNHRADVNARDNLGGTPLHHAADAGEIATAKLLLAAKAPIEATNNDGNTPLHSAAQSGRAEMVSLLLDSGASVNATNNYGATPLLFALRSGYQDAVRVLLAHKADPNRAGRFRWGNASNQITDATRPIYLVIGNTNILRMLLEADADPEGQIDAPNSPLASALRQGKPDAARLLLEHGANPNRRIYENALSMNRGQGDPFLAIAMAKPESKSAIPLLLEKGADPNAENKDGLAPLFLTTDPEIARWLIEHKADVNARFAGARPSENAASTGASAVPGAVTLAISGSSFTPGVGGGIALGYTPLMHAATSGEREFLKVLLENGAKPDLQDTNGNTALHYAARYARVDAVSVLLDHKANPNIQNEIGYTPLDIAKSGQGGWMSDSILGGIGGVNNPISGVDENKIAELLTQSGGLANLPKRNRIQIQRASTVAAYFSKGSREWNQLSLLESVAYAFGLLTDQKSGEWITNPGPRRDLFNKNFRFPNFQKTTIYRRTGNSPKQTSMNVDLAEIFKTGDCSRDVWLQWGDIVEIPEADHPVGEQWPGLSNEEINSLIKCLSRQVTVKIKDASTTLTLAPEFRDAGPTPNNGFLPMKFTQASFMLRSVLDQSKLLRISSDLSHVKVTRIDPTTKKTLEWTVDCTVPEKADLWLRDSDVIEVPEK